MQTHVNLEEVHEPPGELVVVNRHEVPLDFILHELLQL